MVTTNQADVVVSIARGEVGRNLGGSKYWSWYGFPSRVEWCACFTSWCLHTAGVNCGDLRPNRNLTTNEQDAKDSTDITQFISEGRDALISKGCMQMKDFYNRKNCILSSSQLAKAGDIVLYDWDPEYYNDVDHVGIVEWVEGSSVSTQVLHVIEGNMSTTDNVGRRTISRTSSLIGVICRPTYRMVEDNGEIEFGPDESYYEEYIVTYGDTLGEIAISHGLTVDEVVAYNSITNANVITVGQVIKLPYNGRRSWIGEFQQAINSAGIATLTITDIWDSSTESAAANAIVQSGTTGAMAVFAQRMLMAYAYALPQYGADGDFGSESVSATISYQNDHDLIADGIIGLNTWKRMLLVD